MPGAPPIAQACRVRGNLSDALWPICISGMELMCIVLKVGRRPHALPLTFTCLSSAVLPVCLGWLAGVWLAGVQGTDFSPNVFQLPLPDLVPLRIPVIANKASTDEEG